ncbi:hypothetical protein [Brevifollis gellanilyticus]|nr:hypothetical protein [Brevifollis gellanilyticus]
MKRHLFTFFATAIAAAGFQAAVAELPPYVYEERKAGAPEHLELKIVSSEVTEKKEGDTTSAQVKATAEVVSVKRTRARLKPGESIVISYGTITKRPAGWAGPSSPGVLTKDMKVIAWLAKEEDGTYAPVAGGQSFAQP